MSLPDELKKDMALMETGAIWMGESLREPPEESRERRVLWAICKTLYDVLRYIIRKEDKANAGS